MPFIIIIIIYNVVRKRLSEDVRALRRKLYIFNYWKPLQKSKVNGEKYHIHKYKNKVSVKMSIFPHFYMDLIQFQSESQLTIFLWKLVRKVSGMIKIFFKENKKRDLPYQMSLKECSKSDKIDQKKKIKTLKQKRI